MDYYQEANATLTASVAWSWV